MDRKNKAGVAMLISGKTELKTKDIKKRETQKDSSYYSMEDSIKKTCVL